MSNNPWSKFFWQDWESDQSLKLCSLAAQGLWMRMLCIAAAHDPVGYVSVAGKPLDETGLARLTGASESEVAILLQELDQHGVFSRDRHGRIYSRRLIRDAKKIAIAKKNGKKGGNPSLGKQKDNSGWDKGGVKGGVKGGDKAHSPEARSQSIPLDKSKGAKPDSDKEFWDNAKNYLGGQKSGALIGKWCRDYGKAETASAITAAQTERAVEPVPYVTAILRKRAKQSDVVVPV